MKTIDMENLKAKDIKYSELENKIVEVEDSYYVVRDTDHPAEDLERNWSTFASGVHPSLGDWAYDSKESAEAAEIQFFGEVRSEFRYHPAYEGWCVVHYEGLGAFTLDAVNLEDALKEANEADELLACTSEAGNGHFFAEDVISYHKVREGRWIFQIS